jgi:hypothetical protein
LDVGHPFHAPREVADVDLSRVEFAGGPPGAEVDADGPHERLRERVVDSLALVARALPAATKVAVAPTLDAKSQVSLSVRFNQVPNASGQAHEPSGRVGTIRRCGRC